MGLDFFDITYRVEQAFGVELTQHDVLGVVRDRDIAVGDLYDLVLKKMSLTDVARFDIQLNEQLWSDIRALLSRVAVIAEQRIELTTPLAELFPQHGRRVAWNAMRGESQYRLPELDYPLSVRLFGILLAAGVVAIEQFRIWQLPWLNGLWPLLGLLGIWMVSETYLKILSCCAPLRSRFPRSLTTAKDLYRTILSLNYDVLTQHLRQVNEVHAGQVWEQLAAILAEVLDVRIDEISFRSRMFRDLGAS